MATTKIENSAIQLASAANVRNIWGGIIVNVKAYGAIGNGVADDTIAIQRAINAVTNGGTVFFPPGTYCISSTLMIGNGNGLDVASTFNNIFLLGSGAGDVDERVATRIKWIGSLDTSMMQFNGVMVGGGIDKIELNGNGIAKHCVVVYSLNHFYFGLLVLLNFRDTGLVFTAKTGVPYGSTNGTIDQLLIGLSYTGNTGLSLDAEPLAGVAGLLFNRVVISGSGNGNTGIKLGYADHNQFNVVSISYSLPLSGTNYGILLAGCTDGNGNAIFPLENVFIQCNPGQGGIGQTIGTGTPERNRIYHMTTGDGSPISNVSGISGVTQDTGGSGQLMPFGIGSSPVVVQKATATYTTTAVQSNIGGQFKPGQDAMVQIHGALQINNGLSGNKVIFGVAYTAAFTGVATQAYFCAATQTGASATGEPPFNGNNTIGNGNYAFEPITIYVKGGTAINVLYQDPTNTPNDKVSVVVTRLN